MKVKKLLSLVIAIVMLMGCMIVTVFADTAEPWSDVETPTSKQIFYTATAQVTPSSSATTYDSDNSRFDADSKKGIMAFTEDLTVIGDNWFEENTYLTSVILPESVLSIGERSFYNCINLTSVSAPEVTAIGESAFAGERWKENTMKLTSISFPKATSIGYRSFYYCVSLENIDMPEVVTIGEQAFENCFSLKNFSFSKATSIGNHAFYDCISVESISLPEATTIGEGFICCSSAVLIGSIPSTYQRISLLKSVYLPKATTIGDGAFACCTSLESITLPEVTSIGTEFFSYCISLKNVSLPKVTSVGEMSFSACSSLESISLLEVTCVGDDAFGALGNEKCTSLTTVYMPKATSFSETAFSTCPALKYVYAPENATGMPNNGLYKVTISASENGTIALDKFDYEEVSGCVIYAKSEKTIELNATPDELYSLKSISANYNDGAEKSISVLDNSFTMPDYPVTISAVFELTGTYLDIESSNTYEDKKEIEQKYTFTQASEEYTDVTKVKIKWIISDIAATYTSDKTWDPDTLTWKETKTVGEVADTTAKFTIINYSSKAIKANVKFVVQDGLKETYDTTNSVIDNNDCTVKTPVKQDDTTYTDDNFTSLAKTITATLKFNKDNFADISAQDTSTKYGTYTITISKAPDLISFAWVSDTAANVGGSATVTTDNFIFDGTTWNDIISNNASNTVVVTLGDSYTSDPLYLGLDSDGNLALLDVGGNPVGFHITTVDTATANAVKVKGTDDVTDTLYIFIG